MCIICLRKADKKKIADLLRQMNILFNGESNSVIFSAIFSVIAAYLQKTANRKVAQAYMEELTEVVLMAWDSGHCKEDI